MASLKAPFGFLTEEMHPESSSSCPRCLGATSAAPPALLSSSQQQSQLRGKDQSLPHVRPHSSKVQDGNRDISQRNQQRAKLPHEDLMAVGEVQLVFRKGKELLLSYDF